MVAALDAIEDLLSERTRLLGLLDEEQRRLSQALQLYAERTRTYWIVVATFGTGRWPLEDVPWRSAGGESGYLTLLVGSIAMKGLAYGPGLVRVGRVLTELARAGRAGDYGPLLLQRTAELAGLVDDSAGLMYSPRSARRGGPRSDRGAQFWMAGQAASGWQRAGQAWM
jgi:hypothetical protein